LSKNNIFRNKFNETRKIQKCFSYFNRKYNW
jgi:hypothetical protein